MVVDVLAFRNFSFKINAAVILTEDMELGVNLEYSKELCELHNDYPLAPDKIKIKNVMLCSYQLKIADFYNMSFGTV